jgi:isopentenyl-diphosphate Delta-isomerase
VTSAAWIEEAVVEDEVILVDENDRETGTAPKLQAHRDGALHRAFSVFLFNSKGEVLLQRRADEKYHSAGLWSNTCCSHPRPGEDTDLAAARRLVEEMGLEVPLVHVFAFTYRSGFADGLWEHEYDHVYIGRTDAEPRPDPAEVAGWRWSAPEEVAREMVSHPERFTVWFREPFEEIVARRAWEALDP